MGNTYFCGLQISMTKNFLLYWLFAASSLIACNNTTSTADTATTAMPEGEKKLRDLIAKYPDSLLLKENLVQYFRENGNYSQAIAETDNALKKDSASERLWYMKAALHSENDDTLQAINAWEKTLRFSPKPEYMMSLGTLYALTKNPLAIAMAQLLTAGGAKYQGLFIQGLYHNSTGDKLQAVSFFDQCISADYTNVLAYREKAECLYDLGKYLDALKTLELAVAVKKTYDEAYYWMGRCYEKLNEREAAIQNYQLALQIDPNYIEAKDALAKMGAVR